MSHLSENLDEIAWVRQLHPDCKQYWQAYDKFGLFQKGTLMAHCVYSDEQERKAIRDAGVVVVHCPDSNTSVASGIAPLRRMLDEGLNVVMGSDIAGGAMSKAQAAKLKKVFELAVKTGAPVVGIYDSIGGRLDEGADMLAERNIYHYNYLGLCLSAFRIRSHWEHHFYCSEFVREVLLRNQVASDECFPSIVMPIHFLELPKARRIYAGTLKDYSC